MAIGPGGLSDLYQEGSARIRFPAADDGVCEAVLINTAGGLTGGDRLDWSLTLGGGARGRVVTQACEKLYRSTGEAAEISVRLELAKGAELEWLPQEAILFDGARLKRSFEIDLSAGARLLALEAVVLGRQAMGETEVRAQLRDRWRVRLDGGLLFANDLRLDDPVGAIARPALLAGARAFASILLIGDDAGARLENVRDAVGADGGASAFDGKLVCRIATRDGLTLRRVLTRTVVALGRTLPRLWTV